MQENSFKRLGQFERVIGAPRLGVPCGSRKQRKFLKHTCAEKAGRGLSARPTAQSIRACLIFRKARDGGR